MIIVADSGSTKCDWMIYDGEERHIAKTMGFNPFFHTTELIRTQIENNEELIECADSVKAIFYYGAGCSSKKRNRVVANALRAIFTHADTIVVDEDLVGAALAVCGETEGIACILGTGSNSCYFDGKKAKNVIPALGYIFGDEGSGSYFGKRLLSDYLYKRMPEELAEDFESEFELTKETIFQNIYHKPNVNVYLASFMRFVSQHNDHPYFDEIIYQGLYHFADIHITCYENYKELPVHFVGSIAYYFRDQLERVAKELGFTIGNVVKKPIHSLTDFHVQKYSSKLVH